MIKSFFNLVAGKLGQSLIGLANILFLLRILNKVDYGYYAFSISLITIFAVLAQFGLTSGLSRLINQHFNEKEEVKRIVVQSLVMQTCMVVVVAILLYLVQIFYYPQYKSYITTCFFIGEIGFLLSIVLSEHYFRSGRLFKEFAGISLCNILLGIARLVGFIGPYLLTKNFAVSFMLFGLLQVAVSGYFFGKLFLKQGLFQGFRIQKISSSILNISMPFFIIAICNILFTQIGNIIIGKYLELNNVADFDAAFRVINIIRIPAVAFSFIISADVGKAIRDNEHGFMVKTINRNFNFFLLSLPVATGILMFSKQLMFVLGGAKYVQSYVLLDWLVIYFICAFFSDAFSLTFDYSNSFRKRMYVVLVAACVSIVLMLFLVKRYHLPGAAISLTIAGLIQLGIFYLLVKNEFKHKIQFDSYFVFIISATIAGIIAFLIGNIFLNIVIAIAMLGYFYFAKMFKYIF